MYTYSKKQLPKHTVELHIEIPWDDVQKSRDTEFARMAERVQAPGFRKGKAPHDMAARYIDPQQLYERVVRSLLPPVYDELLQKEQLKPVASPSIELQEAKENAPWKILLIVPEIPEVKLKDYKKHIIKLHADARIKQDAPHRAEPAEEVRPKKAQKSKSKAREANVSDSVQPAQDPTGSPPVKGASLSEVFSALLTHTECAVPDLLLQEEVNRKLAQLADDVRKVGLTVEKYLESKQTTIDALRAQFTKEAQEMYHIEFVLAEIAKTEQIEIDKSALDGILSAAQTEKERAIAQSNMAWYETLLRKQKVIDFLNSL